MVSEMIQEQKANVIFRHDGNKARLRRKRSSAILEPLFENVAEFVKDAVSTEKRCKRKGKKSRFLLKQIEVSLQRIVEVGHSIAADYEEVRRDMFSVSKSVMTLGQTLISASRDFFQDPCCTSKRQQIVKAADALFGGVTRMLYVADIADALRLKKSLHQVNKTIHQLETDKRNSTADLLDSFMKLGTDLLTVTSLANDVEDVKDKRKSMDLEIACRTLMISGTKLKSAPEDMKVRNPPMPEVKSKYYNTLKRVISATGIVTDILSPEYPTKQDLTDVTNDITKHLAKIAQSNPALLNRKKVFLFSEALGLIDSKIIITSTIQIDPANRTAIEKALHDVIKHATMLADDDGVNLPNKNGVLDACFAIKETVLEVLYNYFEKKCSDSPGEETLEEEILLSQSRSATKELRKVILNCLLDYLGSHYNNIEDVLSPGTVMSIENCVKLHEYVDYMKEVSRLTSCLSEDANLRTRIDNAMKRLSLIRSEVVATSRILSNSNDHYFSWTNSWNHNIETVNNAVSNVNTYPKYNCTEDERKQSSSSLELEEEASDSYWWDSTTDVMRPICSTSTSPAPPVYGAQSFNPQGSQISQYYKKSRETLSSGESVHSNTTLCEPTESLDFDLYDSHFRSSKDVFDPFPRWTPQRIYTPQLHRRPNTRGSSKSLPVKGSLTPTLQKRSSSQSCQTDRPQYPTLQRSASALPPYSSHRRPRRYRSDDLEQAVSDMQLNIAPKLASVLQKSALYLHYGESPTSTESGEDMVDALKMVYGGIQNICNALLDENQFAQPELSLQETVAVVTSNDR